MPTTIVPMTSEQQGNQQASISHPTGLDDVVHPPGCSDPKCLLPSCINMKLRKSHLQKCRKKNGRCDICKELKSGDQEMGALMANTLVRAPLSPTKRRKVQPSQTYTPEVKPDDDVRIIKVVTDGNKQEKNLQGSRRSTGQKIKSSDAEKNRPKALEQGPCNAVIPIDKTAITCSLQEQGSKRLDALQLRNHGDISASNQVVQPPLEVLCNALQALNTVIQLVKSSQLEIHAIPLLEQALAEMKVTALNRLDEKIRPTFFPLINTSIVMEYSGRDACAVKAENQWLPLQSSPPQMLPPPPSTLLPPSSAGSAVAPWQSPSTMTSSVTPPYKTKFDSNPVVELFGDVTDEFNFDDQDIILLDFVEELLG